MTRSGRRISHPRTLVLAGAALALALAGCSTLSAGHPTTASPSPAPTGSPVEYHSVAFALPLTVQLDPTLNPVPIEDSPGLLTWEQTGTINRIRLMIPAKVYGERGEFPVPDYQAYLQTLPSVSDTLVRPGTVTIDGQMAPIVTVQSPGASDGSIGCSSVDAKQDDTDHCFAFGPDYTIRIVSLMEHGKTLVAWARTSPDKNDKAFNALFEKLLSTIVFQ